MWSQGATESGRTREIAFPATVPNVPMREMKIARAAASAINAKGRKRVQICAPQELQIRIGKSILYQPLSKEKRMTVFGLFMGALHRGHCLSMASSHSSVIF
jgi:hypothetical protein